MLYFMYFLQANYTLIHAQYDYEIKVTKNSYIQDNVYSLKTTSFIINV